jgi:hypothetical protein
VHHERSRSELSDRLNDTTFLKTLPKETLQDVYTVLRKAKTRMIENMLNEDSEET